MYVYSYANLPLVICYRHTYCVFENICICFYIWVLYAHEFMYVNVFSHLITDSDLKYLSFECCFY